MFLIERLIILVVLFGLVTVGLLWFLATPGRSAAAADWVWCAAVDLSVLILWVVVDWANDYSDHYQPAHLVSGVDFLFV
jgi:hypothetical protein